MKFGTVLLLTATVFAVGCNQDDIFEEEKEARTLAKRMLSDSEADPRCGTIQIEAGAYRNDVITPDGIVFVEVEWTRGYSTGIHRSDSMSTLTARAESKDRCIFNVSTSNVSWVGFYQVNGRLVYDVTRQIEVDGTTKDTTYYRQEYVFNLDPEGKRYLDSEGNTIYL